MKSTVVLLLGLTCLATKLAAQTVYLPSAPQQAAVRERARQETAKEGAVVNKMNSVNDIGDNGYDIVAFDSRTRGIRGTPFLVPTWSQGDVLLGNAPRAVSAVVKFDVYNQQVWVWRAAQRDSIIISSESVRSFTLRPTGPLGTPIERHFERLPSGLVDGVPAAFAEVLSTGNELRLLRLSKKKILKAQTDVSYSSGTPVDSFQDATQYFLRWADGTCVEVKPNRNSILAAVAKRNVAAASTGNQDKAKPRNDAELGELVARLDSVIAKSTP